MQIEFGCVGDIEALTVRNLLDDQLPQTLLYEVKAYTSCRRVGTSTSLPPRGPRQAAPARRVVTKRAEGALAGCRARIDDECVDIRPSHELDIAENMSFGVSNCDVHAEIQIDESDAIVRKTLSDYTPLERMEPDNVIYLEGSQRVSGRQFRVENLPLCKSDHGDLRSISI